jgi:hypothetical protein
MERNTPSDRTLDLEIIGRRLDKQNCIDEQFLGHIKQDFPHLRFILCSEDDTGEREPYLQFDDFDLHLFSGGSGCLGLTHDTHNFRGVVIALREEF